MIEFGKDLKSAREAKGLTCSQLAEKTRLMTHVVEGLEAENFKKIIAPIYGRGFVKLYCEEVGLDPKPYVDEFMRLYMAGKTPEERAFVLPAAEPPRVEEPVVEPAPEPKPVQPIAAEKSFDSLFSSQPTTVHSSIPSAESVQSAPPPSPPVQPPAPVAAPKVSRYSDPLFDPLPPDEPARVSPKRSFSFRLPTIDIPEVPPSLWRMATLVVALILILWGLFVGVRALYRATMTGPEKEAPQVQEVAPVAPKVEKPMTAPAANQPRKAMDIPALYID